MIIKVLTVLEIMIKAVIKKWKSYFLFNEIDLISGGEKKVLVRR